MTGDTMADFLKGYARTNKNEGGDYAWSNNPADPGGETFMGITRRSHPDWGGWEMIDAAKSSGRFPANLADYPKLIELAHALYKKKYWDPLLLDLFCNQAVAEKVYDIGVNAGPAIAIKILQRALNSANKRGKLWPDQEIDGIVGPSTIGGVMACERENRIKGLLSGMKALIGAYYFTLMESNERLEDFYMGWLARAME
jgi:lysozyme family protein